ncbi:MAG TPA: DegV family protein [Dehalococcoidales bacterium]|nr:DegV family protein [Dehalococcoidales bacterium]
MKNVGIVTDTTACVPPALAADLAIEVVPDTLIIDGKVLRDGIDITPAEFYALLRTVKKLPTTAGTPPQPYLEAFCRVGPGSSGVLCLTEPARLTAMFNSARIASESAHETCGETPIEVMECSTAAAGVGLVALAAAREAAAGKSFNDVKIMAGEVMSRTYLFAAIDTLQYLARSGRVPQAAAMVNEWLDIKPVFTVNHAEPHTVALPRTIESALDKIIKLMQKANGKGRGLHVAVMHADVLERAKVLRDRIVKKFDCREIYITEFTPVMGVHAGPGVIGAAFYAEKP